MKKDYPNIFEPITVKRTTFKNRVVMTPMGTNYGEPDGQYQIDSNCYPDGWRSYMAKAVKEKYGKPVITMGNIRSPKVANDILDKGDADFIGIGRGLIADPDWVNKAEFGCEDDIRKCISCNIGCAGNRIGNNRPIRCTVNPAVLVGDEYKKLKVNKDCNVVVIGGGTTGMESAGLFYL